ncbi:MAG: hypothetical protein EOO07_28175 [Chitinophagaceae bacterium]|nr:MAG: hypothetical protein EOO07_28175 [Chitinophagaceae bacterium]
MKYLIIAISLLLSSTAFSAEKPTEPEIVKPNQELPKILYIVPWKDIENGKNVDQKLALHDFFGDLYNPILPSSISDTVDLKQEESAE